MSKQQIKTKKGRPKNYVPFRARGEFEYPGGLIEQVEFDIICPNPNCASDWIKKDGVNERFEQMFECKECGKDFVFYACCDYAAEVYIAYNILVLLCKGCSRLEVSRKLNMHPSTISNYMERHDIDKLWF